MFFDSERKSLELETKEAKTLYKFLGSLSPVELGPEVSDFYDRLQYANVGAAWGRAKWEEMKIGDHTHFRLSDTDKLEIPKEELGTLYRGLQIALEKIDWDSERTEMAVQARDGIQELLSNEDGPER